MMPVCNAHGLDKTWAEPDAEQAQHFFNNLTEIAIREETDLIRPTTEEEVAYIATRVEEAALAAEDGSLGFMGGESSEEETVPEGAVAGEHNGAAAGDQIGRAHV